jgi:hypothetical protein
VIRLADRHAERAPDQRGKETRRLNVQFVRRRLLPDASNHDTEQDQNEDHRAPDGKYQKGQHQLPALLLKVRSMDVATAKFHARP